jgi:bifunctional UDP-N-acetylglucosamine pyrophosphorylase / glucosamine-1-phosphate N-acetyltransferase
MHMTLPEARPEFRGAGISPHAVIEPGARIEEDVTIYPFCYVGHDCVVKQGATLYPHTVLLEGSVVGEGCKVYSSHISASEIGAGCLIGPFAHLRDGAMVQHDTKIGNYVEVKKSVVGAHTFVSHLAYVGDATIGDHCNLAAGCITANFNTITGEKHRTIVEDGASIGANSVLIAPITIKQGGFVAASTTVTEEVPTGSLAVGRQKQRNIHNWVEKQRKQVQKPEKA